MEIKALYTLFSKHWMVDTDTRKIRKNTIFFALKGENFNGNTFATTALDKGASFSVVDQKEYQTDANIILVDNVLKTLQKLARYHRVQLGIPIISLTGSNGKTTTKELINAVLKKQFKTCATIGNLNNHIGVPLSLLSIQESDEIGIIEMGANHQKEIEFLCDIAAPDFGYITNFGKAHLEGLKKFGYPALLKARRDAYDGKGNFKIDSENEVEKAYDYFKGQKLMLEKFVPFKMEVSVIASRNTKGEIKTFNAPNFCCVLNWRSQVREGVSQLVCLKRLAVATSY